VSDYPTFRVLVSSDSVAGLVGVGGLFEVVGARGDFDRGFVWVQLFLDFDQGEQEAVHHVLARPCRSFRESALPLGRQ